MFLTLSGLVFVASFLHSLAGFGFPLLMTPLVAIAIGIPVAVPLVALLGLTLYTANILRYRIQADVSELLPLAVASVFGIPIGMWALSNIASKHVKLILGLMLIAYALFAFSNPKLPARLSGNLAYLIGFVAGCLSGAYNSPGLPVVVYGALRQWSKDKFRTILQALLLLNSIPTVLLHVAGARITAEVYSYYWVSIPALALGVLAGMWADSRVDKERFRMIVTTLVMILGIILLLDCIWSEVTGSRGGLLRQVSSAVA